eukprot:TRINITY_DN543_c0_g1_i1.p1 TRINITY_DN543_c0_g1~~TRINITY_DN543_c0_g1_i1.p1  ORF type:complete len:180 (-),score=82.53 TRINITY_DN543_c0_g1_i1:8-487(-)
MRAKIRKHNALLHGSLSSSALNRVRSAGSAAAASSVASSQSASSIAAASLAAQAGGTRHGIGGVSKAHKLLGIEPKALRVLGLSTRDVEQRRTVNNSSKNRNKNKGRYGTMQNVATAADDDHGAETSLSSKLHRSLSDSTVATKSSYVVDDDEDDDDRV